MTDERRSETYATRAGGYLFNHRITSVYDPCARLADVMQVIFDEESEYHFTTFDTFRDEHILVLPDVPETLLQCLEELRREYDLCIYGYVIMPNHMHLIWYVPQETGMKVVMKYYKGWTGGRIVPQLDSHPDYDVSRITRPSGSRSLWKRGFYDFNLTSEGKFLEKLEYVHQNPVRWGLVANPEEWPYSSFRSWYELPDTMFEIDRI